MSKNIKKVIPASMIVTQSNDLVSARYTLTLSEQRLLLMMLARIQPDDEDFKPYKISIAELADFLGIARGSAYLECKKITKSLLARTVEIKSSGELLQTGWVSSARYIDGTGTVILCFDPLLKPLLLQLKGNFTSCKLEMLLSFKSQYTMRLYTYLKQYQRLNGREMELAELREILGLSNDQHQEYKHLKSNILMPVQKELSEKADLSFEFDEIKYGRQVGALYFHIFTNKTIEPNNDSLFKPAPAVLFPPAICKPPISDQLRLLIPAQHRTKRTVQTALEIYGKQHGFDYVKRNILYSNAKADKSYAGFLNNALKEDWGGDWELEQKVKPEKQKVGEIWEQQGFSSLKKYEDCMFRKQMQAYGVSL